MNKKHKRIQEFFSDHSMDHTSF